MANFEESKHPRAEDGKFTSGGGSAGGAGKEQSIELAKKLMALKKDNGYKTTLSDEEAINALANGMTQKELESAISFNEKKKKEAQAKSVYDDDAPYKRDPKTQPLPKKTEL